jgi:hypothetical protein
MRYGPERAGRTSPFQLSCTAPAIHQRIDRRVHQRHDVAPIVRLPALLGGDQSPCDFAGTHGRPRRALRQELKRHVPRIHDPASVIGMGG